jgi:flagellar motor switch protein FliG
MILTAVGPELASEFLRDLSRPDLQRFAQAVNKLGPISQDLLDAVVVEFLEMLTTGSDVWGGEQAARKLFAGFMSEDEIARLLEGGGIGPRRTAWDRLNETPIQALANFLQGEHPQTGAVILSEMRAEIAATVLERLDRGFAQAIVLRLSRVPALDFAVSSCVQAAIDRDFLSALQGNLSKRRPADLIAGLMNNISIEAREEFLGRLEREDSTLAQDVVRTMFTFDDIAVRIHGRDVATILRDLEDEVVLKALKLGEAQNSPSVPFMLQNIPRRLSERYVDDLANMTEVSRKEGEVAQIEITKAIQIMARAGSVRFIEKDLA